MPDVTLEGSVTARAPSRYADRARIATASLLALAIFAIDISTPVTYGVGMGYVLAVLLGLWVRSARFPLLAAGGATAFLVADLAAAWSSAIPLAAIVNRSLTAVLLWATALFVLRFKGVEADAAGHLGRLEEIRHALDVAAIVAMTDVAGRITFVNDKFCEISGFSRDELLGQDHRIVNSGLHPKAFMQDLWHTIANGRVWHGEIRNRKKDGGYYWVDTTIVPFLNARGKPYQYVAIRADITERKLAEERLRSQEALARVGQLAAMVAHEVRNPLAGIKAALQVIKATRPPGDPEAAVMQDIIDRADALNGLVSDLLLFARPRPPQLQIVSLHGVLGEALDMVRRDPLGAALRIAINGEDVALSGDRMLLRGVFQNLVLNAAQAMQGSGAITVRTSVNGPTARVEIHDSGPGIPETHRGQVFEPFFTTKSRGGGLGLPIARRSVELHGGTLALDCPPQGGTVATVQLPVRAPAASPVA
ncbi:MAG: PAS domain S-box protein [Acidimicrobiia bacterium]|nr:PAS domain S-box protein [Acidimicrobiia bacterium]